MKNSKKPLLLSLAAVAAIAVTVFFLNYPPVDSDQARGSIGVVQKHQEKQIVASDVVLMDETQRRNEALLYSNLLEDAILLANTSHQLSSFSTQLQSKALEQKQMESMSAELSNQVQAIDNRSKALAQKSMANVEALMANKQLSQFSAELQSMRQSLASQKALSSADLASFNKTLDAAAKSLEQKGKLQAQAMDNAEGLLASFDAALANKSLNAAQIENVSASMENASKVLQAAGGDSMSLGAAVRQLQSEMLQSADLLQARNHLAAASRQLQSNDVSNLAASATALNAVSATLANDAVNLESQALENMEARLESVNLESSSLAQLSELCQSVSRNLQAQSQLSAKSLEAKSIDSFNRSLGSFQSSLQNAEQALGQKFAGSAQQELAAVDRFLNGRTALASQGFNLQSQALAARSLGARPLSNQELMANKALASKSLNNGDQMNNKALASSSLASKDVSLESYRAYLAAVSKAMENHSMENKALQARLGSQASELQNKAASLESKARN